MKPVDGLLGFLLWMWLIATPAQANPPEVDTRTGQTEDAPSLEFLEFLGEFETQEGDWIDPEELEQMELADAQPDSKEADDDPRE